MIQLPASKDCVALNVMSGKEKRYPAAQCEEIKARSIFMTSESWKMLRKDVQTNCQFAQCRQIEGAADGLFLAIDRAFAKMPL